MDQETYDRAAEKIERGQVVEVNGRTAASREELDWIREVEDARPAPQPETAIRQAAERHAAAEAQRVRDAEAGIPPAAIPPSMPDALAQAENPTTTLEGLAGTQPVNPGQPEAARETGAGPVVEGALPTSSAPEPAGDAAAENPNLNPANPNPEAGQDVLRDVPSPPRARGR